MKFRIIILVFIIFQVSFAQNKKEYLSKNRVNLRSELPNLTEKDFNLIGFGALHGSAKTYEAEYELVKYLVENKRLDYYIIEANSSQAYYLQKYLESGDENLLKELVFAFQTIVSQEGTVETFNHWKRIRALTLKHSESPFQMIGFDVSGEYKFPLKQLLELSNAHDSWQNRGVLFNEVSNSENNFTIGNKDLNDKIKTFIEDYYSNKAQYKAFITDVEAFDYIVQNLHRNFKDNQPREKVIYENYVYMKTKLNLGSKKQFAKYGFFHIQKEKEGSYPSFFTRLIENKIYDREKIITVMAYLTKSKVLWDKIYDKQGEYKKYTTKSGYGISDYWKEYFEGIKYLKQTKLSDLTMFKLNASNSPYAQSIDLVQLNMFLKDFNTTKLKGKNTLKFIDYAILISHSKEQIPLETIKN
ncbi:MAG: hypothetical protein ACPG6V_11000 [Flavobacteriales bacterium]